jgi:dipeptidyl aminopeptidase/acylaminoacyl peptidase
MSPLKIEDFYDLRFLGNINVAKQRVFFEVFKPLERDNKYESGIYELKGSRVSKYTRGSEDRDAVVDRGGNLLAYLVRNDKKTGVFIKDIGTGQEWKVWETEMKIKKMEWDSSSKGIYMDVQEKKSEGDFRIIEKYPIYYNGEGFFPSTDFQLLRLGTNGKVVKIVGGSYEIEDFAVNPLTGDIAIIIRPEGWDVYDSRLGILNPKSGEIDYLEDVDGGLSSPVYDQEGRLYFLFSEHKRSIFESPKLFCYEEGKFRNILGNYDISPENSVNSDSRMGNSRSIKARKGFVYFIATVEGRSGIFRVDHEGIMERVVKGALSVDSFDFKGDSILFIAQSSILPQEIYQYDGKIKRMTKINSRIEKRSLSKPKNFRVETSDGKEVEGWMMRGKNKGTILEIHGGPRTSYGEAFSFEFQLLNSAGFNVIYSNPRGSDSYGDAFALEIKEKYGERDYKDIMEVIDYAVSNLGVKEGRMGVIGGSYGGFMVNWIVGHTDYFKAAITDRSISDQISLYFSSDIGPRFNSDQMGGTPYDNLDHYWDKSPLKYIKNVKTPLLIIHSDEDYRCPIWQAYELFTQLKKQGSEVRMISFKGENHDLSRGGKPKNRVKRLEEVLNWFEKRLT